MNLYLDDDTIDRRLIAMLGRAGHRVVTPSDANLSGAPDAQHFIYANEQSLTVLTHNHDDFRDLHQVVHTTNGKHCGLLIIRSDNDVSRDMTTRQIVSAIANLESSGVPIENEMYILNHGR